MDKSDKFLIYLFALILLNLDLSNQIIQLIN